MHFYAWTITFEFRHEGVLLRSLNTCKNSFSRVVDSTEFSSGRRRFVKGRGGNDGSKMCSGGSNLERQRQCVLLHSAGKSGIRRIRPPIERNCCYLHPIRGRYYQYSTSIKALHNAKLLNRRLMTANASTLCLFQFWTWRPTVFNSNVVCAFVRHPSGESPLSWIPPIPHQKRLKARVLN